MLKSFKTEIKPTQEQKQKINKTIGVCRFVYNLFLDHNKKAFECDEKFVSGQSFSVWLNNEYIPQNTDHIWIKDVSAKSVKQSIMNCDKAFRRFFKEKKKPNYRPYSKRQIEHSNKFLKGEATRQNIQKQALTVQKLHMRLANMRSDYISKIVNDLAKTNPNYITIEGLNVSGIMKNRHLSKAVAQQKFYGFRTKLENKCRQNRIELRVVDRFYLLSKLCHNCGCIKTDLKLSDRIYKCDCGYTADRDYNASLNLRDAKIYKTT